MAVLRAQGPGRGKQPSVSATAVGHNGGALRNGAGVSVVIEPFLDPVLCGVGWDAHATRIRC
jgi:hypothetical protein